MSIQNSKKYIMALAALQILVFHQWIPLMPYGSSIGQAERFLVATSYIGVDLFFFLSAYSLSLKPVSNYKEFILNRFIKLMPLFLIAYIMGHFLWFIPALMIVYIVLPLIIKPNTKIKTHSFLIAIIAWAVISWILLKYIDKNQVAGIFLFRIPIIILGVFASQFDGKFPPKNKIIIGLIMSTIGIALIYEFGYLSKINKPFKDIFYLAGIPLVIGILLLIDALAKSININAIKFIGDISLEMYFVQIVIGSKLVRTCLALGANKLLTNILSFAIVIVLSAAISKLYKLISN